ncbi:type II toxin-antitoxin system prevent-host-death family antitoxin [Methylomonas sp. TEB]|uniref:type II toxin-antitoxin system prevent-host-death family antitoxin n=1 Tax=Methylomonas sp. TEB TaxID=3398229 RepID=UPI0039F59CEA
MSLNPLTTILVSQLVRSGDLCNPGPYKTPKRASANYWMLAQHDGPQMVTKRGKQTAVLVPVEIWNRLQANAQPSLKQLLLSDEARAELTLPARGHARRRPVAEAD